jgi:hypothetical protein
MQEEKDNDSTKVSLDQVEACLATLNNLLGDTNQLYELPEALRVELMKSSGLLSRPERDEFQRRRKDSKKADKRKQQERDRHARKETGIRSAREAAVFVAPKLLDSPVDEEELPDLSSPRNCYVCNRQQARRNHSQWYSSSH